LSEQGGAYCFSGGQGQGEIFYFKVVITAGQLALNGLKNYD